jgi:DNA polymerase-4
MTLRCLFVDFNSFFASVEQQDNPALRGKPVGVVPVVAATTCCIAASIEAKELHDIRTGTPVWEAMDRCPDFKLVEARPARYVEVHHQLMNAIEECIPHAKPDSIDEVPCYLIGRERQRDNAIAIAESIKRRIARDFDWIRCSIGIAPNRFLAKTASDMQKPDGLTVLEMDDLPHKLHALELRDFCGIGPSMEQRLIEADIHTVQQLCGATREHLRAAWGSRDGERFWLQLRGQDVPERITQRGSIGHSHVLGPELRSFEGARSVLFKLLAKAAMRLRKDGFQASGLSIRIRFVGLEHRFERDLAFAPIDDTSTFLHLLGEQLAQLEAAVQRGRWNPRRHPPLSVAVTLVGLQQGDSVTGDLMANRQRDRDMSHVVDRINQKYNSIYFGAMQQALAHDAAPMRIPFSQIPETAREQDVATHRKGDARNADLAEDLILQGDRQFKVLAENAHREAQKRKRPSASGDDAEPFKAGAGGWSQARKRDAEPAIGETRPLF